MKRMLAGAAICTIGLSASGQGAEIVVFGDSWANRLAGPLGQTVVDQGVSGVVVLNAGVEGARADELSSSDPAIGLPAITAVLMANPDARYVHLSIGGNDLFDGILFINNDSIVNSLLNRVVGDTEDIVRHILSVRPDVEVYHSGYDFLRPILFFSPARVNEVMLDLDGRLAALAATIPGYTYEGFYGFAQVNYGMPELGLPPGDPSLPNPSLPSPASTFVDEIHYTPAVYEVFADELYVAYYRERLETPCLADVNGDGAATPADFSAWVAAFNAMAPACDQNGDGACSPADFSAWVSNFNAGC